MARLAPAMDQPTRPRLLASYQLAKMRLTAGARTRGIMNFIPQGQNEAKDVPYYEDAQKEDGWQGHTTTKSVDRLKSEVTEAITRLGGFVSGFQMGTFLIGQRERQGFQIHYSLTAADGRFIPGRLDIAALPVKHRYDTQKKDKSLRMALYMLRIGLDGMWLFQQLSPGYAPLMPFMIANAEGKTVSQLWAESPMMSNLLPPGDADFIEAEVTE